MEFGISMMRLFSRLGAKTRPVRFDWRFALCLLCACASPLAGAQTINGDADVAAMLDRLEFERAYSAGQMIDDARRAFEWLQAQEFPDEALEARACLTLGRVYYTADQVDAALSQMDECALLVSKERLPNWHFRIRALRSVLLLTANRPEESLSALSQMLAEQTPGIDPAERLRVQYYFASALFENDQLLAANDQFRLALERSLSLDEPALSTAIANNYIVALIDQQDYDTASRVLQSVKPLLEQSEGLLRQSLLLHELQLQRLSGDPVAARDGLQNYIDSHPDALPIVLGNAYEFLANALRDIGDVEASLEAAEKAVQLLGGSSLEEIDARFSLAETLLALQQPYAALTQLSLIEERVARSESRTARWLELRIRALFAVGDIDQARAAFSRLLATNRRLQRSLAEKNAEYYQAQLVNERQQLEIERIEASQAALEERAKATAERADTLAELAESSMRVRIVSVVLLVLLVAGSLVVFRIYSQQQFERRLRDKERELNATLSEKVAEQSEELLAQVEEQNVLERALAQKMQTEVVGQLTGNVAHDFNNLMQVVRVANEHLDRPDLTELQRSLLEGSNTALDHATAVIRQLLAFARRQTLEAESIVITDLLAKSRPLFKAAVGDAIELVYDDQSGGISVLADRGQLATMLLNLLTNARDAMPRGGKIVMHVDCRRLTHDDVKHWTSLTEGEYLAITVEDEGIGMPPEVLARAFDPFFTTKGEQSGTGLGLSSALGFIRQSGGDVRVLTTSPAGTSICIMLPTSEQSESITAKQPDISRALAGRKILLVEDNSVLARTMSAMLGHLGAEVRHVLSADEAVDLLAGGEPFHGVLSDVRMPGHHDGFSLHAWAREQRPGLPVILMSGFSDSAFAVPDVRMISKPFSSADLVQCLSDAGAIVDEGADHN